MTEVQVALDQFKGAKVTVMGLGIHGGGAGATRFFAGLGAEVTVTDLKGKRALAPALKELEDLDVNYVLGRHVKRDFESCDMVIVNPAVPEDSPYIRAAKKAGVRTESVLNFFLRHCPCPTIGITGTNGKSTTTSLLGLMLEKEGLNPYVGGNIGGDVLHWLDRLTPDDIVVLEMSSFQLKALEPDTPSPKTAVLTNLAPNHLDRHITLADYYQSKARIFGGEKPPRRLVVNVADPDCAKLASGFAGDRLTYSRVRSQESGVMIKGGWVCYRYKGLEGRLFQVTDLQLNGQFNVENAMAAAGAAILEGCSPDAIQRAVKEYRGLEHRLKFVGKWREVTVYNDSKSTNPTSTIRAIESVPAPVFVVLGGSDKDLELADFAADLCRSVKGIICYGEAGNRIYRAVAEVRGTGETPLLLWLKPFEKAVERALSMASPGDTVLLSPAFASFDQFQSFEERGDAFAKLARSWGERGELRNKVY